MEPKVIRHTLRPAPTTPALEDPLNNLPPEMRLPMEGEPVRIFRASSPTQLEQVAFEKIGMDPRTPLPADVASRLQEAVQQVTAEPAIDYSSFQPVKVPEATRLEDLPTEKQREIAQFLQRYAEQAKREIIAAQQQQEEIPPGASESVARAIREALQQQQREPAKSAPAAETPPQQSPPSASSAAAEPAAEQPAAVAGDVTSAEVKICPHCGWDLSVADTVALTERDKEDYFQAWLGGIPFIRNYSLFNGRVDVAFRELRVDELDACYQLCWSEQSKGKYQTLQDWRQALLRTQLCLSLVSLKSEQEAHVFPETLAGWNLHESDAVKQLEAVRKYVWESVLKTETRARLVSEKYADFGRRLSKLAAWLDSENF